METMERPSIVYTYNGAVYLNITSRCPTACSFCIKSKWDWKYRGYNLKLANEPSVEDVLSGVAGVVAQFIERRSTTPNPKGRECFASCKLGNYEQRNDAYAQYQEAVFCGYGESTYRLAEMKEISRALRAMGFTKIRLNTVGLGNLINGRDIAPTLAEILDSVSISLNTSDPKQYIELHRPLPQFRDDAFESVLDFIRSCVKHIPETVVSAIKLPDIDTAAVASLADSLGARFRLRPSLNSDDS